MTMYVGEPFEKAVLHYPETRRKDAARPADGHDFKTKGTRKELCQEQKEATLTKADSRTFESLPPTSSNRHIMLS